jgi:hypothetical protein
MTWTKGFSFPFATGSLTQAKTAAVEALISTAALTAMITDCIGLTRAPESLVSCTQE